MFTKKTGVFLVVLLALMLGVAGCGGKRPGSSGGNEQAKYPTKPVKFIVTHDPGSTTDIAARLMQPYLQKELGQPVVIENRPGAGGRVAATEVFKAKNDGYTYLVTCFPNQQVGELLYKPDFRTDEMTPVYCFVGGQDYYVLYVAKDSPYKTFKEMVDASQKKPVTIGITALGSGSHFVATMLKQVAGLRADVVTFEASQVLLAVMGKQVDAGIDSAAGIAGEHGQRIRALVQTSDDGRSPFLPDVQTTKECGYTGAELAFSVAILAPPNTPRELTDVIVKAMDKVTHDANYVADCKKASLIPCSIGPDGLKKLNEQIMAKLKGALPTMQKEMKEAAGK